MERPQGNGKRPTRYVAVVDHCHKTERVRGLLHSLCNIAIGQLEENPDYFRSAINYLEDSSSWPGEDLDNVGAAAA